MNVSLSGMWIISFGIHTVGSICTRSHGRSMKWWAKWKRKRTKKSSYYFRNKEKGYRLSSCCCVLASGVRAHTHTNTQYTRCHPPCYGFTLVECRQSKKMNKKKLGEECHKLNDHKNGIRFSKRVNCYFIKFKSDFFSLCSLFRSFATPRLIIPTMPSIYGAVISFFFAEARRTKNLKSTKRKTCQFAVFAGKRKSGCCHIQRWRLSLHA